MDLQAHGHTADVDRPLRYQTLADDIAGLIGHLGLAQADVMGYSFGGATALRTAIQHPHLVRRLVLVSEPYQRDGWYPESVAGMEQMGSRLAEPLKQSPVYQVYANADAVRPEHIVRFYRLLGGGLRDASWDGSARSVTRLAILPGHTHYDTFASPELAAAVVPFLDAPSLEPPTPLTA